MSDATRDGEATRNGEAKLEILGRIRSAHAHAADGAELGRSAGIEPGEPGRPYPVPRDYVRGRAIPGAELVNLLVDRLEDYRAEVIRCADRPHGKDGIGAAVAGALAARGLRGGRVGIPPGLDEAWLGDFDGDLVVDDAAVFAPPELDALDAVVTGSAVTSADTGTIMLDGSPACGRRALTLVPDVHICVVRVESIVAGVPEAIARLAPVAPITMISGPSATSDIELNRVEGVHGPRTLVVVVAG